MFRLPLSCRICAAGLLVLGLTVSTIPAQGPAAAPPLQVKPGDHISIIGNTLADRMQHDGWLETYLATAAFRSIDLVFRNLGFSGDELTTRLRCAPRTSARPISG